MNGPGREVWGVTCVLCFFVFFVALSLGNVDMVGTAFLLILVSAAAFGLSCDDPGNGGRP